MILIWLIVILFVGGAIAGLSGKINNRLPRVIALVTVLANLALFMHFCSGDDIALGIDAEQLAQGNSWIVQVVIPWIPQFGINFHFAMDGISLLLIALTLLLSVIAVLSAWSEIDHRSGFFYFNLLWTLAGVVGVFTALDLFLFFFFWEVMLIPMFLLIGIWGHEEKEYAALKFFLFTQVSGLLGLALIFFLLGAPFAAALEILVYAGAILVLFVFAVMMLNLGQTSIDRERALLTPGIWLGPSLLCLTLLATLIIIITSEPMQANVSLITPKAVGIALYGPYLLAVELASMLLMAGLIGAYHLARPLVKKG